MELTNETLDLYDNIIRASSINTYNTAKDGKIILRSFNNKSYAHLFEFEVARIVQQLYVSHQVYLDMPFWKFLIFKWKNRREIGLKWISHKEAERYGLDIEDMLLFVSKAHELEGLKVFEDIYKLYWKKEK